ncbi:MAG: hypothetical protein ACOZQL_06260 [Myxococcota bacterium]
MMLALFLAIAAAPKPDARLVGAWQLNGQTFLTLNANGTGLMDGDPLEWKADASTLTLTDEDGETDRVPFALDGDTLKLEVGGLPMTLTRGGKPGAKASRLQRAAERSADGDDAEAMAPAPQPTRGTPRPQPAGNDQLSRLLLSSNWCWLRYSNGNSYTQKVHFSPDGTWQDFSESDLYVNNQYAQTVTQSTGNQSSGGQWAVRNGQLWLSSPDAPQLQPIPLTITRNSNGAPLINADGREYSMCR